jgi:hypothetical protein
VAFSSPPIRGPAWMESSSVAVPSAAASGMMAIAAATRPFWPTGRQQVRMANLNYRRRMY